MWRAWWSLSTKNKHACVYTKSLQSCATLCDPIDCSPARFLSSWEFSRQEYWSGLPCLSPEDLPNPGIESESLTSPALAGGFFTTSTTWEAKNTGQNCVKNNYFRAPEVNQRQTVNSEIFILEGLLKVSFQNSGSLQTFLAWCGPSHSPSPSSISGMLVYQSNTDYENKQLHIQRGHPWFRAENKIPHFFQLKLANSVGKEWSKYRTSDLLAWNCRPSQNGGGDVEHSGIELGAYGGKRAKQVLDMLSTSPETTRKLSGCAGEMQAREFKESKSQGRLK